MEYNKLFLRTMNLVREAELFALGRNNKTPTKSVALYVKGIKPFADAEHFSV